MNPRYALFNAANEELKHLTSRLNMHYNPINFGTESIPDGDTEQDAMLKIILALGSVLDRIIDEAFDEI